MNDEIKPLSKEHFQYIKGLALVMKSCCAEGLICVTGLCIRYEELYPGLGKCCIPCN